MYAVNIWVPTGQVDLFTFAANDILKLLPAMVVACDARRSAGTSLITVGQVHVGLDMFFLTILFLAKQTTVNKFDLAARSGSISRSPARPGKQQQPLGTFSLY